jgi:hypothetical protein
MIDWGMFSQQSGDFYRTHVQSDSDCVGRCQAADAQENH